MVRPARVEDRDGIIETIHEVYVEYGWPWYPDGYHEDLYQFASHYLTEDADFFVAEQNGQVVGACGLETYPLIPGEPGTLVESQGRLRIAGTACELVRLYVRPSARRLGLGRRLTECVVEAAQRRGLPGMEIWSDKRLDKSHGLYRSIGGVIVGDRLCHDPEQSPEWGFYLPLK